MIAALPVAGRDRKRLAEIVGVASRFGLGAAMSRFGLSDDGVPRSSAGEGLSRRVRLALEELGPTFVKLGQILATRADLLAPDWISELELLHSQAPTLPFDLLRPHVEASLGQSPESAFSRFDPLPLAAASMAQVHRAALADGREVVVKIRRPGIRTTMEADIRLLGALAELAERTSGEARRFAPTQLVRELGRAVLEELDFTGEGRNADRLRADFANDPRIEVPVVHWEWSSETVLVMDFVEGVHPTSRAALEGAGLDPSAIARAGADAVLDMVLVNGRFHADPHPGNLICLPSDRIALIDLGMVGTVSPRRREEFVAFVQALAGGDPVLLSEVLGIWSEGGDVPPARLLVASERLLARHSPGRIVLTDVVADFLSVAREERLTLPTDLLLILKALLTIDGVLSAIDPEFDLSAAMTRASFRAFAARLSPDRLANVLQSVAFELLRVGGDAPRLMRAAIRRLESGPVTPAGMSGETVRAAARTIALGLLLSALMVSAALLVR